MSGPPEKRKPSQSPESCFKSSADTSRGRRMDRPPAASMASGRWGVRLFRHYLYYEKGLCRLLVFSWYLDSSMYSVNNIC